MSADADRARGDRRDDVGAIKFLGKLSHDVLLFPPDGGLSGRRYHRVPPQRLCTCCRVRPRAEYLSHDSLLMILKPPRRDWCFPKKGTDREKAARGESSFSRFLCQAPAFAPLSKKRGQSQCLTVISNPHTFSKNKAHSEDNKVNIMSRRAVYENL